MLRQVKLRHLFSWRFKENCFMLLCENVLCLFNIINTPEYYVYGIMSCNTFNINHLACSNISIYFIHDILGDATRNLNNKFQASTKAFIHE